MARGQVRFINAVTGTPQGEVDLKEVQEQTRSWEETSRLWEKLANERGFPLIRVKNRDKAPNEGQSWQNIGHRAFHEIGFGSGDNAGVLTGPTARLLVLDVDDLAAFTKACHGHGWDTPATFTVKTGKGFHYYYRLPSDDRRYRSRSKKAEGWDIRADSGFVVAPGSIHPSGAVYSVADDRDVADAPQWLLKESAEAIAIGKLPRAASGITIDLPDPPGLDELAEIVREPEIVKLIVTGAEKGKRSEVAYRVIKALLAAGCEHEVIASIFMEYEVGEKAREKADSVTFLFDEIDRIEAKEKPGQPKSTGVFTLREDGQHLAPMDEPNDAPYRLMRIPTVDELPRRFRKLVTEAHGQLVQTLREYDNNVSPTQSKALLQLVNIYGAMAANKISGRIAAPLPTGMGKTTSIVAFLSTAYRLEILAKPGGTKGVTVAVAASKVDQLCELCKSLVSAGVPSSYISLVHSYKCDPDVERDADGLLPTGYAELPADDLANGVAPIMLLTHNKVKNGPTNIFDKTLQNRTLMIWDESLVTTESGAFAIERFTLGLPVLDTKLQELKRIDTPADRVILRKVEDTHLFLRRMLDTIQAEVASQFEGRPQRILRFTPMEDGELNTMFNSIDWVVKQTEHGQFRETIGYLRNLLRMSAYDAAVHRGKTGKEAVVRFDVVVPDIIENIVVLDASTRINKLMMLDGTIWTPKDFPELKLSYEKVTFHRIGHRAGRASIEEELKNHTAGLTDCIGEILNSRHPDEAVLFFTYKHREGDLNHREAIEKRLTDQGIDLQEKLTNGKHRFNWLTHGNETASNKFTHCTVAIFVGILHKPDEVTLGQTIAQRRTLTIPVEPEILTDVVLSQHALALHQGANRTASRIIKDDLALGAQVYYVYPSDALVPWVREVMPGAAFRTYLSEAMVARTRSDALRWKVMVFLDDLVSQGIRKLSGKLLTREVRELGSVSKSAKDEIVNRIVGDPGVPWAREGRSLVYIG